MEKDIKNIDMEFLKNKIDEIVEKYKKENKINEILNEFYKPSGKTVDKEIMKKLKK